MTQHKIDPVDDAVVAVNEPGGGGDPVNRRQRRQPLAWQDAETIQEAGLLYVAERIAERLDEAGEDGLNRRLPSSLRLRV